MFVMSRIFEEPIEDIIFKDWISRDLAMFRRNEERGAPFNRRLQCGCPIPADPLIQEAAGSQDGFIADAGFINAEFARLAANAHDFRRVGGISDDEEKVRSARRRGRSVHGFLKPVSYTHLTLPTTPYV